MYRKILVNANILIHTNIIHDFGACMANVLYKAIQKTEAWENGNMWIGMVVNFKKGGIIQRSS